MPYWIFAWLLLVIRLAATALSHFVALMDKPENENHVTIAWRPCKNGAVEAVVPGLGTQSRGMDEPDK